MVPLEKVCILLGLHFSPVNCISPEMSFLLRHLKTFSFLKAPYIYNFSNTFSFYIFMTFLQFKNDRKVWSLISVLDKWPSRHTWEERNSFVHLLCAVLDAAYLWIFALQSWNESHMVAACALFSSLWLAPLYYHSRKNSVKSRQTSGCSSVNLAF